MAECPRDLPLLHRRRTFRMVEHIDSMVKLAIVIVTAVYCLYTRMQYLHAKKQNESLRMIYRFDLNKDSFLLKMYCEEHFPEEYKNIYG